MRQAIIITFATLLFLFSNTSIASADETIDELFKLKEDLEHLNEILNQQYAQVLKKIRDLKSKKDLSIFEEIELGRLLSKALSISNRLDTNTDDLQNIIEKINRFGYSVKESRPTMIRLRFLQDNLVDGPTELREKALLFKDKEDKLQREISVLVESEKRRRLREESLAFIKEQSIFDEDSTLAVVKKNIRSTTEENSTLNRTETTKERGSITATSDSSTPSFSTPSSQAINVKIEVSYEESGLLNQITPQSKQSIVIDIDLDKMTDKDIRDKIEMLKKIKADITSTRIDLEQKAEELERVFREKKR